MNRVKTIVLLAMVLTAMTAVALAEADDAATQVITDYSTKKITRDRGATDKPE